VFISRGGINETYHDFIENTSIWEEHKNKKIMVSITSPKLFIAYALEGNMRK
jgi:hypothetical protein